MKIYISWIIKLWCLSVLLLLSGCAANNMDPESVLPPIGYKQPASNSAYHSNKIAVIFWRPGNIYQAGRLVNSGTGELVSTLINVAIEDYNHKHAPGKYLYTYGKARQVVFITSLKNNLLNSNLFKDVQLGEPGMKLSRDQVAITISFKETRVANPEHFYAITLNTQMLIKSAGKPTLVKHYFVENQPPQSVFSIPSYMEQQVAVSKMLMNKVMRGISNWVRHYR